jgi:hypothetical protein
MLAYNVLGYALGTVLPGAWMQYLNSVDDSRSRERILAWGMRLVLLWAGFGLYFLSLAAWFAHRNMHTWNAAPTPRQRTSTSGTLGRERRRRSSSFMIEDPDEHAEEEFNNRFNNINVNDVTYEMNRRPRANSLVAPPPSVGDVQYMITMLTE